VRLRSSLPARAAGIPTNCGGARYCKTFSIAQSPREPPSTSAAELDRGRMKPSGSFNGKLRDECLNGEIFYSLKAASAKVRSVRAKGQKS